MMTYGHLVLVDVLGIGAGLDEHLGDIDSFADKERRVTLGVLDIDVCAVFEQVCDQLLMSVGCCGMPDSISFKKTRKV